MRTTLNEIRSFSPCKSGWETLLHSLNKTKADEESVSILQVLDSNGLDDALWCLRAVRGCEKEIRLYAVWCARQVQHLMEDERSIKALDVAEKFANGEVSEDELRVANAYAAAYASAYAATAAANAAANAAYAAATAAYAANAAANAAAAYAYVTANAAANAAYASRKQTKEKQEIELRRICEKWEAENL